MHVPIHLHTHDTAGNGIGTYLMAAEAGVDIVDCAIGSMSSLTSQPSMNSLVEALRGTERDTRIDPEDFWCWMNIMPMSGKYIRFSRAASTRRIRPFISMACREDNIQLYGPVKRNGRSQ